MHQSVEYDSSIERFRTNVSHRSPRRYYVQLRKQDKYRKSSKRIPYKHDKLTKSALIRIIFVKYQKTTAKLSNLNIFINLVLSTIPRAQPNQNEMLRTILDKSGSYMVMYITIVLYTQISNCIHSVHLYLQMLPKTRLAHSTIQALLLVMNNIFPLRLMKNAYSCKAQYKKHNIIFICAQ